jgi:hypothetical protein
VLGKQEKDRDALESFQRASTLDLPILRLLLLGSSTSVLGIKSKPGSPSSASRNCPKPVRRSPLKSPSSSDELQFQTSILAVALLRSTQENDTVRKDIVGIGSGERTELLVLPEIAEFSRAFEPNRTQV